MTYCQSKDQIKRRATDFLALAQEFLKKSQNYEAMAYDAEYSVLSHVQGCDLCQGKPITTIHEEPLLGLV